MAEYHYALSKQPTSKSYLNLKNRNKALILQKIVHNNTGRKNMNAKEQIALALTIVLLIIIPVTFSSVSTASPSKPEFSAVLSGSASTSTINLGPNPNLINTTVLIDIRIDNAVPFWAWGLPTVAWNATVLQLIKVQEGSFLKDNTNDDPTDFIGNSPALWNNTSGVILGGISEAIDGDDVSTDSSGVVVTLTFNITSYGSSPVTIAGAYTIASYSTPNTVTDVTCNSATVIVTNASPSVSPTPTASSSPSTNATLQNARIQVFTNKGGIAASGTSATYGPRDLLEIYALLTYRNSAVPNQDISFSVQNTNGTIIAIRDAVTNQTGIAHVEYRLPAPDPNATQIIFGTWKITASFEVLQVAISNSTTFNFNYLSNVESFKIPATIHRSQVLPIELTVDTGLFATPGSELDITIFDQANVPIGSYTFTNIMQMQNFTVVDATIAIPSWAFTSQATAYICLLTANGTALAPETVANFQILP
jgi:hypothetical protein